MAVNFKVIRSSAPGSSGNWDITSTGFGTPKAAIFILSRAVTDGTAQADAELSIGATDGTREWCFRSRDIDNQSTTDSVRNSAATYVMVATTGFDTASFVSWITDGVRVNWASTPDASYLITVILMNGDDLTVRADVKGDNDGNITDVGFEADALFIGCNDLNTTGSTASGQINLGLCVNDGSNTQRVLGFHTQDNVGTSELTAHLDDDAAMQQLSSGSQDSTSVISDFDSDGFTATLSSGFARDFGFLAMSFGGLDSWVGTLDSPTSTGDWAVTSPGFKPQIAFMGLSMIQTVDSTISNGDAGTMGISTFTEDDEYCTSVAMEDNVGTTNTESTSDDAAVFLNDDGGTAAFRGTFKSFDTNGWTIDITDADATTRKWIAFAVEENSSGTTGTLAGTLPLAEMSASGTAKTTGTFAGTLPIVTMSASGSAVTTITGTLASDLPIPTQVATGAKKETGTFAGTLPIATMSASGSVSSGVTGSFAGTLPITTMVSAGTAKHVGTFAGTLPIPTQSSSGTAVTSITGTFQGTAPLPTMAASGTAKHLGQFAGIAPVPEMTASGAVGEVTTGAFAGTLPITTMAASGTAKKIGTFAGDLPILTLAASGAVQSAITGTFAGTLLVTTMSASGTAVSTITGTFAGTLPIPTMSATGATTGGEVPDSRTIRIPAQDRTIRIPAQNRTVTI